MVSGLLSLLGIAHPIVQAPMAGVSSPAMAAAVCEAGGLGSLGIGASDAITARRMIVDLRGRTDRPFNVNVFCHRPARTNDALAAAWIMRLQPEFARFGVAPPTALTEIYESFIEGGSVLDALLELKPSVVSFHFGVPAPAFVEQLRAAGIVLLGCATDLREASANVAVGVHAVIAQGWEAGGHRGVFDPDADDAHLGALALTELLARELDVPIIAAGGLMDGGDIAAVLRAGAGAAQLSTAFIGCPESLADTGYRAALMSEAAQHTSMTRVISGRPARCLDNCFTRWGAAVAEDQIPDYPLSYDLGKALNAAAKSHGEYGYGAQWAGTGASRARAMPAGELVALLVDELRQAS